MSNQPAASYREAKKDEAIRCLQDMWKELEEMKARLTSAQSRIGQLECGRDVAAGSVLPTCCIRPKGHAGACMDEHNKTACSDGKRAEVMERSVAYIRESHGFDCATGCNCYSRTHDHDKCTCGHEALADELHAVLFGEPVST